MNTGTIEPGALRVKAACQWLGISDDTLSRLIAKQEIRSFTVGRARFVSMAELQRFVADREAEAKS